MKTYRYLKSSSVLIIILFCLIGPSKTIAQTDTTKVFQIITVDDNEYNGHIIEMNEKEVTFKSFTLGKIILQKKAIKRMTEVTQDMLVGNEVWMDNPQSTRYFIGPSSYGLKKGESYY